MRITLGGRTLDSVLTYYSKTQDGEIKKFLPQKATSAEEFVEDYKKSISENSTSYGRTILVNGVYIGDIWCYDIHSEDEPQAMISYCIFEKALWGQGIATKALNQFVKIINKKFKLESIGAFTYSENISSIKVLTSNGFCKIEEFEDTVLNLHIFS